MIHAVQEDARKEAESDVQTQAGMPTNTKEESSGQYHGTPIRVSIRYPIPSTPQSGLQCLLLAWVFDFMSGIVWVELAHQGAGSRIGSSKSVCAASSSRSLIQILR